MGQLKYTLTERYTASALGINHGTLKDRRIRKVIPYFCYQKLSCGAVRYNLVVLKRWMSNPTDEKSNALGILHHKKAYLRSAIGSPEACAIVPKDLITIRKTMAHQELRFDHSEKDTAAAIGISRWNLRDRRYSGEVPAWCYIRLGTKLIRYCLPLILDFYIDQNDTDAHARAQAVFQASRVSSPHNLPLK